MHIYLTDINVLPDPDGCLPNVKRKILLRIYHSKFSCVYIIFLLFAVYKKVNTRMDSFALKYSYFVRYKYT